MKYKINNKKITKKQQAIKHPTHTASEVKNYYWSKIFKFCLPLTKSWILS